MKAFFIIFLMSAHAFASRCEMDKKKFCHNLTGARGEVARCLSEHLSEISPACSKELKEFKREAAASNPCFQELADYCSDVPNFSPNLEYCLMKNESRLGQRCLADFQKNKALLLKQDICAQDAVNLCSHAIKEVKGSITKCLIREQAKLSPSCKDLTLKRIADFRKSNPCFDETEKYCPTQVKVVDIQECLEKRITTLSAQCKAIVQREMDLGKANPCYKDLVRFCKPGLSVKQQHECLDLSYKDLSRGCTDYRTQESARAERIGVACESDRLKYCLNVPLENGMVLHCLRENRSRLLPGCQAVL